MAKDYISIGCTPAAEECVQVSKTEYYMDKMLAQCDRYKQMLQAKFADCNKVTISVKTFPHDFGSYAEVIVKYDNEDMEAIAQAIHIENNIPMNWTDTDPIKFEYVPEDDEDNDIFEEENKIPHHKLGADGIAMTYGLEE